MYTVALVAFCTASLSFFAFLSPIKSIGERMSITLTTILALVTNERQVPNVSGSAIRCCGDIASSLLLCPLHSCGDIASSPLLCPLHSCGDIASSPLLCPLHSCESSVSAPHVLAGKMTVSIVLTMPATLYSAFTATYQLQLTYTDCTGVCAQVGYLTNLDKYVYFCFYVIVFIALENGIAAMLVGYVPFCVF